MKYTLYINGGTFNSRRLEVMKRDREKAKFSEFENILERFASFIRIHIQKYGPQNLGIDPDDVLQEVKIKIWNVLNNEKKIHNYASYIRKIVDSSVIDYIRRLRREDHILLSEMQKKIEERKSTYSKGQLQKDNLKEILEKSVDSLIESRQKVVKLYLLNMTLDEIAEFFNWSRNKTRNLLYRGLHDLKRKLEEKGIEYEDQP